MTREGRPRIAAILLAVGLLAAAAGLVWALLSPRSFLPAYLAAICGWSALPIGCLPWLMAASFTKGRWAGLLRPALETGAATLPAMGLLFLPVLVGARSIYPWAEMSGAIGSGVFRAAWLAPAFFAARTVVYLAAYAALGFALRRARSDGARARLASFGLVAYAVLTTFAAVDWMLSVEPRFHSSIFGLLFVAQQLLGALSLAIVGALWGGSGRIDRDELRGAGLGAWLLAVVLLWIYLHAMQFIVVWSGNIPIEADWYLRRAAGAWGGVLILLALVQGVGPFLLLLLRSVRSSRLALIGLAVLSIAFRPVETAWLVLPAEPAAGRFFGALVVANLAVAGLLGAALTWMAAQKRDCPDSGPGVPARA